MVTVPMIDSSLGQTIKIICFRPAPDLGLGRLGSCPGASTKKGLHKSTYFFNMAVSYSVYHRGLLAMEKICHAQNSNESAGRVDVELAQQAEQVENYWRSVLKG